MKRMSGIRTAARAGEGFLRAGICVLWCLLAGSMFYWSTIGQVWAAEDQAAGSAAAARAESLDKDVTAIPTLAGGELFALVVGVSKYANPGIPALNVAEKDARDFAAFLGRQRELFKNTRVTLLTDEKATKKDVEKFLLYELRKAGKDDTIFIFLSGHGAVDPKRPGEFFFLTHDADPEFMELSAVNMSGLSFLRSLDCPRVVLIADACHAGGFSKWRTKAVMPMKQFIHEMSSSAGRVVITSSRPEEFSLEEPNQGNSLFTRWFLKGLEGAADYDGNGAVTINEAYRYVYERTKTESQGAQHPQFEGTVEGEFPLAVSTDLASKIPTQLELFTDPPGADVFVAGKLAGKTNPDGSMYLKYLPLGRPLPVTVKKEGWTDQKIGPFVFSDKNLDIKAKLVKLAPALASLEIVTDPGGASLTINGRAAGKTDSRGKLMVHGLQVTVPHTIQVEKDGFASDTLVVTIPADHTGSKFRGDPLKLSKKVPDPKGRESTQPAGRSERYEAPSTPREERSAPPSSEGGSSGGQSSERMGL
ncbi:MAG: caspase family protein [Desulfomonile tiedjei]|nr:caspase family protein [Desulfomonile tiedjei]